MTSLAEAAGEVSVPQGDAAPASSGSRGYIWTRTIGRTVECPLTDTIWLQIIRLTWDEKLEGPPPSMILWQLYRQTPSIPQSIEQPIQQTSPKLLTN